MYGNRKKKRMKNMIFVLFFIVRFISLEATYTQCTLSDYAGVVSPAARNDDYKSKTGYGYVNRLPEFTFSCCGVIYKWGINVKAAGAIEMQVWRTSGSLEQLVGENLLSATVGSACCPNTGDDSDSSDSSDESSCSLCSVENELNFTINTQEQVSVIPGDAIGWRTASVEVLTYDKVSTPKSLIFLDKSMPDIQVGGTHSFTENSIKDRMYAVRAYLVAGSAPTFTNLPTSVTILDTLSPGAVVYTPTFSDSNTQDTHTFTYAGTLPSCFTIDVNTGIVTVAQELAAGTFTIDLVVTDICGLQDTGQLTLTISVPNKAPELEAIQGVASIHEDTDTETLVYNLTVTDLDMINCSITNTLPDDAPFMLKEHNITSDEINSTLYYTYEFGIYLKGGPNLSYSLQTSYELNITCNDNELWSSDVLIVYVQQNTPPIFSNLPGNTTISARNSSVGLPVYAVTGTDDDDTILTYNMTCNVSSCPFSLSTGGILSVSGNLLYSNYTMYDIRVYVSDGKHLIGPEILSVFIDSAPTFINLPASVTIPDTLSPGAVVFTPTFLDSNTQDTHTLTHAGTLPSCFTIDVNTGIVTVAQELSAGTLTIDLMVTDISGLQDTGQLHITVFVPNKAPELEAMQEVASIHEDTETETLVYNITVTDSDMINCSITNTVPADAPFMLKEHNRTSDEINSTIYYIHEFGIYLKSGSNLSYSLQTTYELNITCNDNELWSSDVLNVYVQQNTPPRFSNLPGNTTISARNSSVGLPVYAVTGTDDDDTILTYNMTCNVSSCPFFLSTGGILSVSGNLLYGSYTMYGICVYVSDGNHLIGPEILYVFITDPNNPPVISSLPSAYYLSEHASANTLLLTFSISDADVMDNLSFSFDIWPVQGNQIFDFNTTSHEIYTKPGAVLDYETINDKTFNVTFTATDNIDYVYRSLIIHIQDENDPPEFLTSISYVWVNESQAGAYISGSPSYIEHDAGDTVIYKIRNGSGVGYVHINMTTGILSFSVNYDIDQGNMPTAIDVQIEIKDTGGLTDTSKMVIYILNVNDNAPTFNATSYTFTASTSTTPGTSVGRVCVSDADDVSGSSITYIADQASLYKDDFIITNNGEIITLITFSNFTAGQLLVFGISANDNGSPSLSANVNVTIVIIKSNSSLPVTLLSSATETGNSPEANDTPSMLTILIILVGCVFVLLIITLTCQLMRIRREKNRTDTSQIHAKKETSPKPKPLPPLHRMTSTTLLLSETGFWKRGADVNEHPSLRRAISNKHFSQNMLRSSQSKVSDLSRVKNNSNMPRILETSGVYESRLQGLTRERTSLRF